MCPSLVVALRRRAPEISARWRTLMRAARNNSVLTNPDVLSAAIPISLDRIYLKLEAMRGKVPAGVPRIKDDARCNCVHNPFFALYPAGEQALLEAVVYIQAEQPEAERNLVNAFAVPCAASLFPKSTDFAPCATIGQKRTSVAPERGPKPIKRARA